MGGSLITRRRRAEEPITLALAAVVIVLICAVPFAALLIDLSAVGTTIIEVWSGPRPWKLLARSVILSASITVIAMAVGTVMGVLIARCSLPARRALWLLHLFPLFLPPFFLALGWSVIAPPLLFSEGGLIAVSVLAFTPIASTLVALSLLGVDASLEESARVFARPSRVVREILLPTARPALVLAAVLIFALSFSELGVPMFLRVDVFPAAVFSRLGGMTYMPGEAFALSLPIMGLVVFLLIAERRLSGARAFTVGGLRGMTRAPLLPDVWRVPASACAWLIAALGLIPIAGLAARVVTASESPDMARWADNTPWTSLAIATLSASLIAVIGLVVGHAVSRKRRGADLLDATALLAFLAPAPVFVAGLLATAATTRSDVLYGGFGLLIVAMVARHLAIGIRASNAVMLQMPVRMEEAAVVAGAGYWRRLLSILMPSNRAAAVSVWLLVFIFCLRDFETAVLLYPPGGDTLTVRIFTLEANGPSAVVASLALFQIAMTAVAVCFGLVALAKGAER